MPTVTSITVDLKAETARFEKSIGDARRSLSGLQKDVHGMTSALGSLGRAGATLGLIRGGLAAVQAGTAAWRGEWEAVDKVLGALPLGFGPFYRQIHDLADDMLGISREIEKIWSVPKGQDTFMKGLQGLARLERELTFQAKVTGLSKAEQEILAFQHKAEEAQIKITEAAVAAGVGLEHAQVRAARGAVDRLLREQVGGKGLPVRPFADELGKLTAEYDRLTMGQYEFLAQQYEHMGMMEHEIGFLVDWQRANDAVRESQERLGREVADMDASATRAASAWIEGIQADVDAAYDMVREGQSLQASVATPMERMRVDVARFAEMMEAGAIDPETFRRAVKRSVTDAVASAGGMDLHVGAAAEVTRRFTMAALPGAGGVNTAAEIARNQLAELAKIYEVLRRMLDTGGLQ